MRTFLERTAAGAMDSVMCAMMNRLQWRLRDQACAKQEFETYITRCEPLTREEFYEAPPPLIQPIPNTQYPIPNTQ